MSVNLNNASYVDFIASRELNTTDILLNNFIVYILNHIEEKYMDIVVLDIVLQESNSARC